MISVETLIVTILGRAFRSALCGLPLPQITQKYEIFHNRHLWGNSSKLSGPTFIFLIMYVYTASPVC